MGPNSQKVGRGSERSNLIIQGCWPWCYSVWYNIVLHKGCRPGNTALSGARAEEALRKVRDVCQPVSCVKRVGRAPWTSSESPGGCGQRSCQCSGQKLLCRKSQKGTSFRHNPGPFWKRVSLRPRTVLTLFPTQPNCWLRVIQEDTTMHQPSLLFL